MFADPSPSAPAALWLLTAVLRAHPEYLVAYLAVMSLALGAAVVLVVRWPHQALPGGEPAEVPAIQVRRSGRRRRAGVVGHAQQYVPGVASVDFSEAERTVALTAEVREVAR